MATANIALYSIGHSNVPIERLIELLERHGIATLCDVRSAPYSRYNPQFNREELAASLRGAGIAYRFMGDALGGKPASGAPADYARIAASPPFLRGIEQLIALGRRGPTAFMCGEADYRSCHRHKLVSPALIERGVVVWHILHDGGLERGAIEPRQLRMF
jgi:uncharacterized protein (DUF488 family)